MEAKAARRQEGSRPAGRRPSIVTAGGRQDGHDRMSSHDSLLEGLRAAWNCRAYVILNATYLATWLCFQVLAGRFHLVHGPFWLRFTYATPVLIKKLTMETPGQGRRGKRCYSMTRSW